MGDPIGAVERYVDAWNRRDPDAVKSAFEEGGSYLDTSIPAPLVGDAIADHAAALFRMFPDLKFDVVSMDSVSASRVVMEWVLLATDSGHPEDREPTGRPFRLPGCDVIDVGTGGVSAVHGYFDQKAVFEQLGFSLRPLAASDDVNRFGTAQFTSIQDKRLPGAIALTAAFVRDAGEHREVGDRAGKIVPDLLRMKGFIGFLGAEFADRLYTLTLWEEPDDIAQLQSHPLHRQAVRRVYQEGLTEGGMTSVWEPVRVLSIVRCAECREILQTDECPSCNKAALPGG